MQDFDDSTLQACGTESEECFDVEISMIPRSKTPSSKKPKAGRPPYYRTLPRD